MIDLLTLLTLSASSASSAVPSSVRLARIAEIRNRLRLVDAPPTRPLTDYERFLAPMRAWPQWAKWAEVLASRFGAMSGGIDNSVLLFPGPTEVMRLLPYRDTLVRWLRLLLDPASPVEVLLPSDLNLQAIAPRFVDEIHLLVRQKEGFDSLPSHSFAANFHKLFPSESSGLQPRGVPRIESDRRVATMVISDNQLRRGKWSFSASIPSSGSTVEALSKALSAFFDAELYTSDSLPSFFRFIAWSRWIIQGNNGLGFNSARYGDVFFRYEESVEQGPPMTVILSSSPWDGKLYENSQLALVHPDFSTLMGDETRRLIERSGLLGASYFDAPTRRPPADARAALFQFVDEARRASLPPSEIRTAAALFPFVQRAEEAFFMLGTRITAVKTWCTLAIPSIIDWAEAERVDLSRLSPSEAWGQARTWHRGLAAGLGFGLPPPTSGPVLVRWADGATLQKLDTRVAIRDEGTSMGHCVGGPIDRETRRASGSSSYIQAVRDGTAAIWSYRDSTGLPRATLEVAPTHQTRPHARYVVSQVQGPNDGPVDEESRHRLRKCLVTMAHHLPDEYSFSNQSSGKLSRGSGSPVNWNNLSPILLSSYEGWLDRFKAVESQTEPPRFIIPAGLGALVEEGVYSIADCLLSLDVDFNVSRAAEGDEIHTELAIYSTSSSSRLLFTPQERTTSGHGWRVMRSPLTLTALSGYHFDPLMALVEAGIVTIASEGDDRRDEVVFIAGRETWAIQPWLTPAGNPPTKTKPSP